MTNKEFLCILIGTPFAAIFAWLMLYLLFCL